MINGHGLVRLTKDPELTVLPNSDMMIAKFGVAWNTKRKGVDQAHFIDCMAWRKTAEILAEHVTKGQQIAVTNSSLNYESWTDKEGVKRSKHTLTIDGFEFVGGKAE